MIKNELFLAVGFIPFLEVEKLDLSSVSLKIDNVVNRIRANLFKANMDDTDDNLVAFTVVMSIFLI